MDRCIIDHESHVYVYVFRETWLRTDVRGETFGRAEENEETDEEEEERTDKHSSYLRGETSVDGALPFRGNMVE